MAVTPSECMETLIKIIIAEVEQKTGKKITREDILKGYKYVSKRRVGRKIVDAKVNVKKPDLNRLFMINYVIENNTIEMKYHITPIDDSHIKLEYTQQDSQGDFKGLAKFLTDLKMKKRLKSVEEYIIANRNK